MKKAFLLGGSSIALVAVLALAAVTSHAATDRYQFVARGIVTAVDVADKSIRVEVTKAPGKAFDDLEGETIEFKASAGKFFKRVANKDKRVTLSNVAVGQEIGFKGAAKDDDTYTISWLRIHDRSFEVVGLVKEHDEDNKTLKVLVSTSSYKSATYKGTEVTMRYTDDSKFRNKSTEISFNDLDADDQKVKVSGNVVNSGTWEITKLSEI